MTVQVLRSTRASQRALFVSLALVLLAASMPFWAESSERGSAVKISSSAFWTTIDSPKVTTSEGSGSLPSVPLSTQRCSA